MYAFPEVSHIWDFHQEEDWSMQYILYDVGKERDSSNGEKKDCETSMYWEKSKDQKISYLQTLENSSSKTC